MKDHPAQHRHLYAPILFFLIAMQVLACRARTERSPMEQDFEAFYQTEWAARRLPERQRISVLGARYDQMAAPLRKDKNLNMVTADDLEILYHTAKSSTFYTHDRAHVREMASFLNELQGRGLASKTDYVQMYEAFVGARMLTEASALARQHPVPEMEVLPELHEAAGVVPGRPTEWVVNPNERELLLRNVDLSQPAQVVIVSHPLCHFSQAAMRDIQADPVLGEVFKAHAKWLAPQDNRIDFDVIQKWNRQHPTEELALAFRREDWPMIDSWATPTFYFLKNGELTAKVEGWPKAGRRSELLAALRQVGLLP